MKFTALPEINYHKKKDMHPKSEMLLGCITRFSRGGLLLR